MQLCITSREALIINPDNYRCATELLAFDVQNWQGEEIGSVEDLIIDPTAGFISYLLVRVKTTEQGPILYPIPSIAVKPEKETFYINISRDELISSAPTWNDVSGSRTYGSLAMQQDVFRFWSKTGKLLPGAYIPKETAAKWYGVGMRTVPGSILQMSTILNHPVIRKQASSTESASNSRASTSPSQGRSAEIGTITDLIVHPDTGNIFSIALSPPAEKLQTNGSPILLPLSTLTYNLDNDAIMYDITVSLLEDAPTLNGVRSRSRQLADSTWRQHVIEYWERAAVSVELRSGMRVVPGIAVKVSELAGYAVVTPAGRETGQIKDIVVTNQGETPYAMMDFHPQYSDDDRWYYIPFQALTLDRFNRRAVLGVKWNTIQRMPGTAPGTLPDTSNPEWDNQIRLFWERLLDRTLFEGVIEEGEDNPPVTTGEQLACLAGDLISSPVVTREEELRGELDDLIIDVEEAAVLFGAIFFDGFLNALREEVVPVPFAKISPGRMEPEKREEPLFIDVTAEAIRGAEKISLEDWPELSRLREYETKLNK